MKSKVLKVLAAISLSITVLLLFAAPALAAKPAGNNAGAVTVGWNLSGSVMPAPPYGQSDILGSDIASKLIVNQPMGSTAATVTGVMKGLDSNTTYTVVLSNPYTAYHFVRWDVAGTWVINVKYLGVDYPETLILTQTEAGIITGVSLNTIPPATGSAFTIISGSVVGNTIIFDADQDAGSVVVRCSGTIAPDGSMSGDWWDIAGGSRTGKWSSTSGHAANVHTGDDWHTGLFTQNIQPFTFMTDESGAGSWHVNMSDADFPGSAATYQLSVWINGPGGTILISDNFGVTKG